MAGPTKKIPQSIIGRTSRLMFSGAKMMTREVAGRLGGEDSKLATRIRQAEELVATLGQLKGAAMKAGQLLSLEFSDLLPPEVTAILRKLHDDTTFMPLDQVRFILGRQLGRERLSDLEHLSTEPIAAASIGQVHRATLHGKPVAVKIQYPGVSKSIDSDLNALRRVALIGLQMQGKKVDIEGVFQEIVASLKKEADYRLEADNIDRYRAIFQSERYAVPSVYRDYSSEGVLTLSFEEGMRIGDWLKSNPSRAEVAQFADLVINLCIAEVLTHGLVQTDPNFGNFLYRPKEGVLVLLDFGATMSFAPEVRENLRRIMVEGVSGRTEEAVALVQQCGYISPKESSATLAHFHEITKVLASIMQPQRQPNHFRDDVWQRNLRELSAKIGLSVEHTAPPKQLMFLGRKLGGMGNLLKDLEAVVDMTPYYQRCLDTKIL